MNSILRLPAVIEHTGLSRSSIYSAISKNQFPKPISLGPRSVGWVQSDVEQWIKEKIHSSKMGKQND